MQLRYDDQESGPATKRGISGRSEQQELRRRVALPGDGGLSSLPGDVVGFSPSDEGLCFVGPLYELCAIGLCRPALEAFCAGAAPGGAALAHTAHAAHPVTETPDGVAGFTAPQSPALRPLPPLGSLTSPLSSRLSASGVHGLVEPVIDRAYLLKILAEEVGRQFGHPLRPLVELVLNAVDASQGSSSPVVDVRVEEGRVEVVDEGEGMSLRTVLSRLLVPFATDKRPGIDLGRFGVGFFSILGFGLLHPESFALQLSTGDGREGWAMRVISGAPIPEGGTPPPPVQAFGATTARYPSTAAAGDPASLLCSIRRIEPRRGTRVRVTSALLGADAVRSYLRDALHFFPSERALIRVDGVAINDGRLISGGRLFQDPAGARGPDGAPLLGRYHVGGRGLFASISAATFHAGVKVEPCLAVAELALIDFPAAVELTEGRDALKPGPALEAVAAAFYRRLVRLADETHADRAGRDRLAEVAAQISALMLRSAGWAEVASEIALALLGPDRYLVPPDRREPVLGFFGPAITERLFVPESFWAERQWQPFLPGERELIERELEIQPPEPLAAAAARRPDLRGLAMLADRAPSPDSTMVALCRPSRRPGGRNLYTAPEWFAPGPLPCLATRRFILVREDSPAVAAPMGWRGWYALRAAFDRAAGVREPEFERDLIVGEALGTGGGVR